jgi:predicted DNA-binding ribbon-helix-helix protein
MQCDLLAQIIATEQQIRELMKSVCDHGDYKSCKLTQQVWEILDQLRTREIIYLENEQIECTLTESNIKTTLDIH